MAEKRGLEDQNLIYEFNTAGSLEVFVKTLNDWYRVTAKDFRSFNGPRQITLPQYVELGNVDVDMATYEYYGPVYQYGSNAIVDYSDTGSIEKNEYWERARQISNKRG